MSEKKKFTGRDIISASEIGQFHFCSISWFLQKCGYKPISPSLKTGLEKHKKYGDILDITKNKNRKSRLYAIFGYILLIIASFFLFYEVFL